MTKAYSVMTVKSFTETEDTRTITGIASTPKPDRDDDIVEPSGVKFALPLPLLWQHDSNSPIGEVTEATVTDKGVEFVAKIAKVDEVGILKDRLDAAWQSIKSGLVKCVSVGFRALEYDYLEDSYGIHIKSWEWYELSLVTLPANSDAVITSVKNIKQAFSDAQNSTSMPSKVTTDPLVLAPQTKAPSSTSVPNSKPSRIITLVDPNQGSIRLLSGE